MDYIPRGRLEMYLPEFGTGKTFLSLGCMPSLMILYCQLLARQLGARQLECTPSFPFSGNLPSMERLCGSGCPSSLPRDAGDCLSQQAEGLSGKAKTPASVRAQVPPRPSPEFSIDIARQDIILGGEGRVMMKQAFYSGGGGERRSLSVLLL